MRGSSTWTSSSEYRALIVGRYRSRTGNHGGATRIRPAMVHDAGATAHVHAAAVDPEVWVVLGTPAGLRAAEVSLAVPGVWAAFVGPFDLSTGLGIELEALLGVR